MSEATAKGPSLARAYFARLATAPALVDIETRRMASRAEDYAKGRVEASANNLVTKEVAKIVGCAARARTGKTFLGVLLQNEPEDSASWEPLEAFNTASGLLRRQQDKLLEFQSWLSTRHPAVTLPIPKLITGSCEFSKATDVTFAF